jgi:uncharacterized protein YkwD
MAAGFCVLAATCAPVVAGPNRTSSTGAPPVASPSACCSALERSIVQELNRARTDPSRFAAELEALLPHYRGYIYRRPGADAGVRTVEGADALREAVRVLRGTRAVPPVRLSPGMSAGAADHVRDQGPRGGLGHTGRDRSSPSSRISRYGRWFGLVSENIQYGRAQAGHDVIADLLIDDGVPDRGHRRNALDPNVRVVGVACGRHATYDQMCVIVHAADYAESAATGREPSGTARPR